MKSERKHQCVKIELVFLDFWNKRLLGNGTRVKDLLLQLLLLLCQSYDYLVNQVGARNQALRRHWLTRACLNYAQ